MSTLRVILLDQISESITSLRGINKADDIVMMCECIEDFTYIPHHPKKIAFQLSAIRHFRDKLLSDGYRVEYTELSDKNLSDEILRITNDLKVNRIIITEPSEYRVQEKIINLTKLLDIEFEILADDRFLCTKEQFAKWAKDKKQLRMEFFYREMRKKYKILLEKNGSPVGGSWNYDKENREVFKEKIKSPRRISHKKDQTTISILEFVSKKFNENFGKFEPFHFAVTREQALMEAKQFMQDILPNFGKHQDVMVSGEAYLFHSLLSTYLNIGLLLPLELCQMAENEYHKGKAPLNSVEGFIRQILGWREYIRGIYWTFMPKYLEMNFLGATRSLPDSFWGKPTKMFCIEEVVNHTKEHAYSHHIQRLMITGNFALLTGINPVEVHKWYLAVYADAYEWVEVPNTMGMALFSDGGIVASKPYAASGKYINRMSDFCKKCKYDPEKLIGDDACPFNALYWNFFIQHKEQLKSNRRLAYVFSTLNRFDEEKKDAITEEAKNILNKINLNVI